MTAGSSSRSWRPDGSPHNHADSRFQSAGIGAGLAIKCEERLEARVGIEPTYKGFADRARQFVPGWRSWYGLVDSIVWLLILPTHTKRSKQVVATKSATVCWKPTIRINDLRHSYASR